MALFEPYDKGRTDKEKEGPVTARQKRVVSIGEDVTAPQS